MPHLKTWTVELPASLAPPLHAGARLADCIPARLEVVRRPAEGRNWPADPRQLLRHPRHPGRHSAAAGQAGGTEGSPAWPAGFAPGEGCGRPGHLASGLGGGRYREAAGAAARALEEGADCAEGQGAGDGGCAGVGAAFADRRTAAIAVRDGGRRHDSPPIHWLGLIFGLVRSPRCRRIPTTRHRRRIGSAPSRSRFIGLR